MRDSSQRTGDDALGDLFEGPGDLDVIAALAGLLEPVAPSPSARAALLDAAREPGRLHRFAAQVAALVDVSIDKAKALLDRLADPAAWERGLFPGLDAVWVEGGPAAAQCVRGFGRLAAGAEFPLHDHLGRETMLILEGGLEDSLGARKRPGDLHVMDEGTRHAYHATPGGADLLFFVVIREGIVIDGAGPLRHRDAPAG